MDNKIKIGNNWYTPKQIEAINEIFGDGFLQANPHFPASGSYRYPDFRYTTTYPVTLQERQERNRADEKQQQAREAKDNAIQSTLMIACAESASGMGQHEETIVAYVRGNSRNDCREKFVRQHLGYQGENWKAAFDKWAAQWHYVRFEQQDFIE